MTTISRAAKFAERTSRLRASTIREMLKVTQQPDIISFGGGLPAPELFPTREIADCTREVMDEYGPAALQYCVTEGIPELRDWVAERLSKRFGHALSRRDILITNGSQQGLDLVAKIFVDPGDHIVLEHPSYLGAIQAFDAYQARYLSVQTDEDGIVPESLEQVLDHADPFPKFLYLIPNFQNPTGRTLSYERREAIVRICERFELPIVEDDPYGELRFEGEDIPPLASYSSDGCIIYLGTGSKIIAPGLRVAWMATKDTEVREKVALAKQGADLQSGSLAQYLFLRYAGKAAAFEAHVERIKNTYHQRRDVMADALGALGIEDLRYNRPQGGMFLWATLSGIDTTELLAVSAQQKVVFVPGVSFYPQRDVHNGMRLNFSNAGDDSIRTGIARLGEAIRSFSHQH
ncbi:MAG: aminotransferase-like domain-containing protein [Vulcanimicrobiaceae bacterium]